MKGKKLSKSLKFLSIASAAVIFSSVTIITSEQANAVKFSKGLQNFGARIRGIFTGGGRTTPRGPEISAPTLIASTNKNLTGSADDVSTLRVDIDSSGRVRRLVAKPQSRSLDNILSEADKRADETYRPLPYNPHNSSSSSSSSSSTPKEDRKYKPLPPIPTTEHTYENIDPTTGGVKTDASASGVTYSTFNWETGGARPKVRTTGGDETIYTTVKTDGTKVKPQVAPKPPKKPNRRLDLVDSSNSSTGFVQLQKKK